MVDRYLTGWSDSKTVRIAAYNGTYQAGDIVMQGECEKVLLADGEGLIIRPPLPNLPFTSTQQVATFFRSRAELEEKYARSLVELTRISGDSYGRSYCKAG